MNSSAQKTTLETPQAKLEEILKLVEYKAPRSQKSQEAISEKNAVIQSYIALKQNAYLAQKQLESKTHTFDQTAEYYHDIYDRFVDHQAQNQDLRDRLDDLLEKRNQSIKQHSAEQQQSEVEIDKTLDSILRTLVNLDVFSENTIIDFQAELSENPGLSRQSAAPEVHRNQENRGFSSQLLNQIAAATHELQSNGKLGLTLLKLEKSPTEGSNLSKQIFLEPLSPGEIKNQEERLSTQLRQLYDQRNTLQFTKEKQAKSVEIIDLEISQHQEDIQNTNHEITAIANTLDSTKQQFDQISKDWDQSIKQQLASHEASLRFVLEMRSHLPLATQEDLINDLYLDTTKTLRTIEVSLAQVKQNNDAEGNQPHTENYSDAIRTLETINETLSPFLTQDGILISSPVDVNTNNLAEGLQQTYENTTQEILKTLDSDSLEDWLNLKQNVIHDFQQRSAHWSTLIAEGHKQTQTLFSQIKERSESLDELTETISQNLSGPLTDYETSQLSLQDTVDISDVRSDRYDTFQSTLDNNVDQAARLKLLIGQIIESQETTEQLSELFQSEKFYEDLLNAKNLLASKDPDDQSKAQDLTISLSQEFIEYLDPKNDSGIALNNSVKEAIASFESLDKEKDGLQDTFDKQVIQLRASKAEIIDLKQEYSNLEQEYSNFKKEHQDPENYNNTLARTAQYSIDPVGVLDGYQRRLKALRNQIRQTEKGRDATQKEVNETARQLSDNNQNTNNTRTSLFDETEAAIGPLLQERLINEILELPHRFDIQNQDITPYLEQEINDLVRYEQFYQDLLSAKELFVSGENSDQINAQNITVTLTRNLIEYLDPKSPETAALVKDLEKTILNSEELAIKRESLNSGYADQVTRLRSYKAELIDLEQEFATSNTFALQKKIRQTKASRDVTQDRVNNLAQEISDNHQSAFAIHTELLNTTEDVIEPFLKEELGHENLDFPHTTLSNLQQLKLKTAYLFTQSPEIIQATVNGDIDSIIPPPNHYPGTSTFLLNEINQSLRQLEQRDAELTISQNENSAAAAAFVTQAESYEEQSEIHWEKSRKQGPTWSEKRVTYKRDKCGKKKRHTVIVQHPDPDWILWDNYNKLSIDYREQAEQALLESNQAEAESDQLGTVIEAWNETQIIATQALNSEKEFKLLIDQLQVAQNELGKYQTFLETLEVNLIPQLEDDFQASETALNNVTTKLQSEWEQLSLTAGDLTEALDFITQESSEFLQATEESRFQIEEIEHSISQQSNQLELELTHTIAITNQLQKHRDQLKQEINDLSSVDGEVSNLKAQLSQSELDSRVIILDEMLQILIGKASVLNAQQSSLVQKQATLQAQKYVISTESELLEAYLESPDDDYEAWQEQLTSAQSSLDELQVLGNDAELSSQGLSTSFQELQIHLQLRNDRQLELVRDKQSFLHSILERTELSTFYTNEAALKEKELYNLGVQANERLEALTEAGSEEAAKLLEVARLNDLATAAEIYYFDYQDLSGDKKGSCAGGIATAQDHFLAKQYHEEWIKYLNLKEEAKNQADELGNIRQAAEDALDVLDMTQDTVKQEIADLHQQVATEQENIETLQQQLILKESQISILDRIKLITEQTLNQVLEVEEQNLRLAKLEQELIDARVNALEESEIEHLERERLTINREWQFTTAKIELLKQLQTEEGVQTSLNDLLIDLNLQPFDEIVNVNGLNTQLIQLMGTLENTLAEQPQLPESLVTLLTQTYADLSQAQQDNQADSIRDNLLINVQALMTEANSFQSELFELEREGELNLGLIQTANIDLKSATQQYLEQYEQGNVLNAERELLTPENLKVLYQLGLANHAVDISEALTQQTRDILTQVLNIREDERESRKKSAVNAIISTITTALSIAVPILSFIPPLAPIAAALKVINGTLQTLQAAANGDWAGALFSGAMTIVNVQKDAITSNITDTKSQIDKTKTLLETANETNQAILQNTFQELQTSLTGLEGALDTLKNHEIIAGAALKSARYVQDDGGIRDLLSILSDLTPVFAGDINLENVSEIQGLSSIRKALVTSGQISTLALEGYKAYDKENFGDVIRSIGKITNTLSQNFSLDVADTLKELIIDIVDVEGGWDEVVILFDSSETIYNSVNAIENGKWVRAVTGIIKSVDQIGNVVDIDVEDGSITQSLFEEISKIDLIQIGKTLETVKVIEGSHGADAKGIRDALKDIFKVWDEDKDVTQTLEQKDVSLSQLGAMASNDQAIDKAVKNNDTDTLAKILNKLGVDPNLREKLEQKVIDKTGLNVEQIQQIFKSTKPIRKSIRDKNLIAVGDAINEFITKLRDDSDITNALAKLNLSWENLGKVSQITQQIGINLNTKDLLKSQESLKVISDLIISDAELEEILKTNLEKVTDWDWETIKPILTSDPDTSDSIEINESLTSNTTRSITGDTRNNTLIGGPNPDLISGLEGNDVIQGGDGADQLDGGIGIDRLAYSTSNSGVLVDLGFETVSGGHAEGDSITSFENVSGSKFADRLIGDDNKNHLVGKAGHDTISGAGGNDVIRGNMGADILTGGSGANTFQFKTHRDSLLVNYDQITDFKIGIDRIDGPVNVKAADVAHLGDVNGLAPKDIKAALTGGIFTPNKAATFSLGSKVFLALNDNKAGFTAGNDTVVEISGFSGDLNKLSIS